MASRLSSAIKEQSVETGFEAHPAKFASSEAALKFIMGGNAIFTLVSKKTGTRFTYRVKAVEDYKGGVSHFVSLLSGPDNTEDYQYLGQFYRHQLEYAHGRKSRVGHDAPAVKALEWICKYLTGNVLPDSCEIWHAARCGRCARKLTVPSSIASGFGPECINHV